MVSSFLYILHNFPPFLVKVSINLTNTSILSFLNKPIAFINFFAWMYFLLNHIIK